MIPADCSATSLLRLCHNRALGGYPPTNCFPDVEGDKPKRKRFKKNPIGYFRIDIAEVQTEQGKFYMFVAIDRASKFTYVELYPSATPPNAASFRRNLIAVVPYRIHTVLTDNGIQFTNFQHYTYAFKHSFDRICGANGIE